MFRKTLMAIAMAMTAAAALATPTIRLDGETRAYVGYHDLDLNSPKGRSKLVRRIHAAVDMICPDSNDLVTFVEPRELCVRTATQSGLSQMKDIVAR